MVHGTFTVSGNAYLALTMLEVTQPDVYATLRELHFLARRTFLHLMKFNWQLSSGMKATTSQLTQTSRWNPSSKQGFGKEACTKFTGCSTWRRSIARGRADQSRQCSVYSSLTLKLTRCGLCLSLSLALKRDCCLGAQSLEAAVPHADGVGVSLDNFEEWGSFLCLACIISYIEMPDAVLHFEFLAMHLEHQVRLARHSLT
eukprot:6084072-Amphidinium_carterae.1